MSRLIAYEIRVGMAIKIHGKKHEVIEHKRGSPSVTLKEPDSCVRINVSVAELAALLVTEDAEITDELDGFVEPDAARKFTDITSLQLHRLLEWFGKLFLLRRMFPMIGKSPKSKMFEMEFKKACQSLDGYLEESNFLKVRKWSQWTIYHDLLRLRSSGYEIGAIQKKGVEYSGYQKQDKKYARLGDLAREISLREPHLSVASVAREAEKVYAMEMKEKVGE